MRRFTWKTFKEFVESQGICDEDWLDYIDIGCPPEDEPDPERIVVDYEIIDGQRLFWVLQ